MVKRRRTEINFLRGFVVSKGEGVGMRAAANAALAGLVARVDRGELQPHPRHITGLRLN